MRKTEPKTQTKHQCKKLTGKQIRELAQKAEIDEKLAWLTSVSTVDNWLLVEQEKTKYESYRSAMIQAKSDLTLLLGSSHRKKSDLTKYAKNMRTAYVNLLVLEEKLTPQINQQLNLDALNPIRVRICADKINFFFTVVCILLSNDAKIALILLSKNNTTNTDDIFAQICLDICKAMVFIFKNITYLSEFILQSVCMQYQELRNLLKSIQPAWDIIFLKNALSVCNSASLPDDLLRKFILDPQVVEANNSTGTTTDEKSDDNNATPTTTVGMRQHSIFSQPNSTAPQADPNAVVATPLPQPGAND